MQSGPDWRMGRGASERGNGRCGGRGRSGFLGHPRAASIYWEAKRTKRASERECCVVRNRSRRNRKGNKERIEKGLRRPKSRT